MLLFFIDTYLFVFSKERLQSYCFVIKMLFFWYDKLAILYLQITPLHFHLAQSPSEPMCEMKLPIYLLLSI